MFRKRIAEIHIDDKWVPLVLFMGVLISFGLLVPFLGFYWDDWPVIYLTQTQGIHGFWDFYQYDRPFSAWTYILISPVLGTNPAGWQIFTLVLRWLTAVQLWAALKLIWPQKPFQVFNIALLFAVCPIFTFQPVAVAYSQHWLTFLLYFSSIFFMLKAQQGSRYAPGFTLLSLLASILNLFTLEYLVGLELLRPVFLWFYHAERNPDFTAWQMFQRTVRSVASYAGLLLIFVIWRIFFLQLEGADPNRLVLAGRFLESPFQALVGLSQKALQDIIFVITSWVVSIKVSDLDLQRPFSIAVLFGTIGVGMLAWTLLRAFRPSEDTGPSDRWYVRVFILGALALVLGMSPVWMIDRQASLGPLGNRFSFAAMFGLCMLVVATLEWMSPWVSSKSIVIAVLIALAFHEDLHTAKAYQNSWEKQKTFYWQLYWRAPHIDPGTAIISEGEIFPSVGLYSTSMAIALLYPPVQPPTNVPYWFFSYWEKLYQDHPGLIAGIPLEDGLRNYSFSGNSNQFILLDYVPELNRCLHIFSPRDAGIREISKPLDELISVSDINQIRRQSLPDDRRPPESIFGKEPEHGWCYFYEKAQLASQYEDWSEVTRLLESAEVQGHSPGYAPELLPLLDAYLQLGRLQEAYRLSVRLARLSNNTDDPVCAIWQGVVETQNTPQVEEAFNNVREKISCFD